MPDHLIYTIAYDSNNSRTMQWMAKLLTSSSLRSGYEGDFFIFHNGPETLFQYRRNHVKEIKISELDLPNESWRKTPHRLKYALRHLINSDEYKTIMFLDADSLVVRDPTHLMDDCSGITFQPERGMAVQRQQFNSHLTGEEMESLQIDGVNSGSFAVKGSLFQSIMAEWERIDLLPALRGNEQHEQGSWNRLILDSGSIATPFPDGSIDFPFFPINIINDLVKNRPPDLDIPHLLHHLDSDRFSKAVIWHTLGPMPMERRLAMTFGLFAARFLADSDMRLLQLLEP